MFYSKLESKLNTVLRCAVLLAGLLLTACAASATPTISPAPANTPTAVAAPTTVITTPVPSPTPDPYAIFLQTLQAAIEQNDEAALRKVIAPTWYDGRYGAPLTQYNNVADAAAAFRALRRDVAISLDLNRAAAQLANTPKLGERIIVAHWLVGGRDDFAYLYASPINGEWRWTALVIGVPAEQVLAQPTATPSATPAVLPGTFSGRLVFTRRGNVYLRDLSTNAETLVSDTEGTTQWDWTRDGSRAVFVRGASAESEIWTINRDGSNARRLTNDNSNDGSPRWQPNGTQILYEHNIQVDASGRFKLKAEIWLMNADGSNKRKLDDGYDPVWSPEGQRIAFASNPIAVRGDPAAWTSYARNGIHLMNAQGRNEWIPISTDTNSPRLTSLEWQMSAARLVDSPHWSPDGREITLRVHGGHGAYVTTRTSSGGFGQLLALFFDDTARGFSYSLDGAFITIATGGLSGWETIGVYRRDLIGKDGVAGTPLRTLGRIPRDAGEIGQQVVGFDWALNHQQIAYALTSYPNNDQSKPPASTEIWIMDIASGESRLLIADGAGPLFWLP